jgi:hypothetical protein
MRIVWSKCLCAYTSKDNKAYNTISVLQNEKLELIDVSQIIENELLQAPATVREVSDK